jgi:hypothetical protein
MQNQFGYNSTPNSLHKQHKNGAYIMIVNAFFYIPENYKKVAPLVIKKSLFQQQYRKI